MQRQGLGRCTFWSLSGKNLSQDADGTHACSGVKWSGGVKELCMDLKLDWERVEAELNERGYATSGRGLSKAQCRELITAYVQEDSFRSRVVMARHGFGRGEYKYYRYPLPAVVAELREAFYPGLARIANMWAEALGREPEYPAEHSGYLDECHAAGQRRPTPLILKYGAGDYNCLHQDLYGEMYFPMQVAFLLSEPGEDFVGGEFVLVEQRPRMQSRVEVVPLVQGEGVIFAVNQRPVRGSKGYYRVAMRHGVSRLRYGERYTLGVIFHDAT